MFFGKSTAHNDQPQQAGTTDSGGVIFEAGAADFEQSVLMASMQRPVLAYFTAPWCGPCKQLGPVLEAAVRAANGEVLMARIDLDSNPELAQALRIQSVPTIYAFFQGRPIDAFQGAVPEAQVRAFIDKLVQMARQAQPDAIDIPEALKAAAAALGAQDYAQAQAIYAQILTQDEKNAAAYAGLVRTYLAAGELEYAVQLVANVPEDIAKDSSFNEAKTALDLAQTIPTGAAGEFLAKVERNPDDHQARFDLAGAQFAANQKAEAIDSLLEIIRRDRSWNEDAARLQLLKYFEALGPVDPLTIESRRKLSSILFS